MNSRESNPFCSSVRNKTSLVSLVSNPTTFSTSTCVGLTRKRGTSRSKLKNEPARASSASRCAPWRVNGWHGGDMSHSEASKVSSFVAVTALSEF